MAIEEEYMLNSIGPSTDPCGTRSGTCEVTIPFMLTA